MKHLPDYIQRLVRHFDTLPGIGPKTATKLVFFLLQNLTTVKDLASDLQEAATKTLFCQECQNVSDSALCSICADQSRSNDSICVVASSQDLEAIEKVHAYNGRYHILHGTINPVEGITPDKLTVDALLRRVKQHQVKEVILAFDQTIDGEATSMYLTKVLKALVPRLTRPARGLPVGSNIEYVDEVTLSSALENRKEI